MNKYELWLELKELLEEEDNIWVLGDWLDLNGELLLEHLIPNKGDKQ